MTTLRKPQLLDRVIESIHLCGWDVLILSDAHPFNLIVFSGDTKVNLCCYIWNLTHGGYPRDPNEMRIQITGVDRIVMTPGSAAILMGWSEELHVFAGFDPSKHQTSMVGRSPSIQIRRETLEKARQHDFFPQNRGNDEIALAFRQDVFISYVLQVEQLHHTSAAIAEAQSLEKLATKQADDDRFADLLPTERREVLETVRRKVRDARFRRNVLAAYSHRCCMCGLQLDLLDAAHIVPVEHRHGTDEVKNGLALCALHHRAFDHALVGIQTDYTVIHNAAKFSQLRSIGWDGGEPEFKSALRDQILLPPRKGTYPSADYLILGQRLRGWAERLIQ